VQGRHDEPVKLPFPDARFDAVSSVGVLEHVRETAGSEPASLAEIVRVLRPGGVFVCYHFPNRYSVIDWLARRVPGLHYHDFRYTSRDIAGFVRGAGLELLECRRYALLPRNSTYHLPHAPRYSRALARAWDAVDGALAVPFGGVAQNYRFVARKPR
jgi:SAM-dependent methyltransferase